MLWHITSFPLLLVLLLLLRWLLLLVAWYLKRTCRETDTGHCCLLF